MASFYEITRAAQRTITITLHGIPVRLTENLMRDPTPEIKTRKLRQEQLEKVKAAMAKSQENPTSAEAVYESQILDVEASIEMDERMSWLKYFCSRVSEWDITDGDGKKKGAVLPLDPEKLYPLPVPTELIKAIIEAMNEVPFVPEANASR